MTRKPWIRISAVVTVLALCLSLPRLFPTFAQASAADDPYGFSESDTALGDSRQPTADDDSFPSDNNLSDEGDEPTLGTQEPEGDGGAPTPEPQEPGEDDDLTPGTQEPGEDDSDPTPNPQQPGADGDDIPSEPGGAGEDTASDDFDEGGSPPAGTDEDDKDPEILGEEETEPPEEGPEEPLTLGASGLTRSSRSVAGYNVFEVDSYAALAEALRDTSYPSVEYPETSVYILLTGDVAIERGFTLHSSIEKVTIDGDGQHTLAEVNTDITYVSNKTAEVQFKNLTIIGNQWFGVFHNSHGTDVSYHYEQVTYTGPQLLHASNSTAHFTDCDIHIKRAGSDAHEVAEIRDVLIHGNNEFRHNSIHSVFFLYNGGNLVLSHGAELRINVTGANNYILFTEKAQSTLRLEDRALLRIEGSSCRLAANAGIHSIYLGDSAVFDWKARLSGYDYITVNASGGAKDAIYLSEGAEFRVAPNGTVSDRLIRIESGNVVVGPGASLSLESVHYTAPGASAPFSLAAFSSLTVGNSAIFIMDVKNSNNLTNGLLSFDGVVSSFHIEPDATVAIRGNNTTGAVYFGGYGSSMEVNAPNYLEIVTSGGNPIYFNSAYAAYPGRLIFTDVQQLNYWKTDNNTYLNGGEIMRRWAAETGTLTFNATIAAGGNRDLSTELTHGSLDQDWTPTLHPSHFAWSNVRILSAGKVGMEVSSDGNSYQGRLTAPAMGVPYAHGAVQLRVGQPLTERAVSDQEPAAPDFRVAPNQTVGANDEIAVWAEYGYIFHNNPPSISAGALSLTVPDRIEFGVVTIGASDMVVPAVEPYSLQVQDQGRIGWQVMASFSGFSNAEKSLNSTLLVNDVPLQETSQRIAASAGNETVPLEAGLLVPGGAAEAGDYSGSITWTLVDAP